MYIARKSNHIENDIKRNWSSWNFGLEGFSGTKDELEAFLASATDSNPVWISGFFVGPDEINNFKFGELYPGYWVAIDNVNARHGLSCVYLEADTLQDAIKEAKAEHLYSGDGDSFDARYAKLVYSSGDIHIFEIED